MKIENEKKILAQKRIDEKNATINNFVNEVELIHSQSVQNKYANDDFDKNFRALLPEKITGIDFISLYGDTIDLNSQINPQTEYLVQISTQHPVEENARVNKFMKLLQDFSLDQDFEKLNAMGGLMKMSHQSYSACGLGTKRTDEIVTMASKYLDEGIFGAKITGGGSGGVVCLLTSGDDGREAALEIRTRMEKRYKTTLRFFG